MLETVGKPDKGMKGLAITIAALGLGVASANAAFDPGAATVPLPVPAPPFLLLAAPGGGAFATPLPFAIVPGDVVLLQTSTGGMGFDNWSAVVRFENVAGHGLATLYTLDNWAGFALDPGNTGNLRYMFESSGAPVTSYTPSAGDGPVTRSLPAPEADPGPGIYSGALTYNVANGPSPVVPEPSTCLAGALLLIPFLTTALRFVRKNRNH